MNLKTKVLIIIVSITIVLGLCIGTFFKSKNTKEVSSSVGSSNSKLSMEEETLPIVKEEIISVSQDLSVENNKAQEEEKEEVVEFKDKKVTVPKSTVASANSSEDAERNKKNGGETVNQNQANEMFQNEGTHSNGIDVSSHQGRINWAQVAASGVDFAIIRCGFRGQSVGAIYEDAYFKTNVAGATANGIKVGIYFYSTAINENEALEEAAWVVKKISTYRITYPVVYDFEDFGAYRCSGVGGAQATSNALTFLNFVRANGYEPMMYANKSDITTRMSRGSFNCKFWLAHYTKQTDYKGSFNMWQYTSRGSVPGISGNVDMDIAYFSYGSTAAPKHTHDYSEVVKNSFKDSTCSEKGTKTLRCSCGDTITEEIPLKEHTYGEWKVVTPATAEKEGLEKRICNVCKKEETRKINKLKSNNIANTENNSNSTNTIQTNTSNTSSTVNTTNTSQENNNTTNNSHTHNYVETSRQNATCTESGKIIKKCSCGDIEEETIPKTGHTPGEWIIDKPATAEEPGSKHQVCATCNETIKTETIPKLEVQPDNNLESAGDNTNE